MTQPGGFGGLVESAPGDLVRRIQVLERKLQEIIGARTLEAASIGAGGLQVTDDGSVTVLDQSSGKPVLFGGKRETAGGARQMVVLLFRDDGTPALQLSDNGSNPSHPHQQALQWFDRAENVVLADDTNGGWGLASPHVSGGFNFGNTDITKWPSTTNTSWTSIANGWHEVINPRLKWGFELQADSGTTGQFRLMINGVQVDSVQTVNGGFSVWQSAAVPLPANAPYQSLATVSLDAQVIAGTGTVRGQLLFWSGDQSPPT